MNSFKVLICDDEKTYALNIEKFLKIGWESRGFSNEVSLDTKLYYSFDEAIDLVVNEGNSFHLAFIDLSNQLTKKMDGINLIHILHGKNPACAVVAITIFEQVTHEQEALSAGADVFMMKDDEFHKNQSKLLVDNALKALTKKKLFPFPFIAANIINDPKNDDTLTYLLETIGKVNLNNALKKISKGELLEIKLSRIKPGLSGAILLKAKCKNRQDGIDSNTSYLLKIANQKSTVLNEYNKISESSKFPDGLRVTYYDYNPLELEFGGWFYMAANFQETAITLSSWLRKDNTRNHIHSCIDKLLINNGMNTVYQETINFFIDENPVEQLFNYLDISRKSRIKLSINDYSELIKKNNRKHKKEKIYDYTIIKDVLDSLRLPGLDKNDISSGTVKIFSHGDFHARNILVDTINKSPLIIDYANTGYFPWSVDIARLIIDLIIVGYDSGIDEHEWKNFPKWVNVLISFLDHGELPKVDNKNKNYAVTIAVNRMMKNLAKLYPHDIDLDKRRWELMLSMGIELMRCIYRPDITVPKRILGIIVSCYAIRKSSDLFKISLKR